MSNGYKARPLARGGLPAEHPSLIGRGEAQVFPSYDPLPIIEMQQKEQAKLRKEEEAKTRAGIDIPGVFYAHAPMFEKRVKKLKNKIQENPDWMDTDEGKQELSMLKNFAVASKEIGKDIMARNVSVAKGEWENQDILDKLNDPATAMGYAEEGNLFDLIHMTQRQLVTIKPIEIEKPTDYWKKVQSIKPSLKGTKIEEGTVTITSEGANEAANAERAITTFDHSLTPTEQQRMIKIEGSRVEAIKTIENDFNLRAKQFWGRAEDEPRVGMDFFFGAGRATSKRWSFVYFKQKTEKTIYEYYKNLFSKLGVSEKIQKQVIEKYRKPGYERIRIQGISDATENKPIYITVDKKGNKELAVPIEWMRKEGEKEWNILIGLVNAKGDVIKSSTVPNQFASTDIEAQTGMTVERFMEGQTEEEPAEEKIATPRNYKHIADYQGFDIYSLDGRTWYTKNGDKIGQ